MDFKAHQIPKVPPNHLRPSLIGRYISANNAKPHLNVQLFWLSIKKIYTRGDSFNAMVVNKTSSIKRRYTLTREIKKKLVLKASLSSMILICPKRSSPLVPNRAVLTRRNYTPVKIGIKLTGKTSGVRVWILFIPKPARLKVICKKLAKICIFPPKKSIKISFIIKSGLQIVFLSSMGYQEHIL